MSKIPSPVLEKKKKKICQVHDLGLKKKKKEGVEITQCTQISTCATKQPLEYLIQDLQKTCRDHGLGLGTKRRKKKQYTKREEQIHMLLKRLETVLEQAQV